jgi:hypothetical protein
MFEWLMDGIEEFFSSLLDGFIEMGMEALDSLGLLQMFNDLLATEPITVLLSYTPLINELISVSTVVAVFSTEFAIIATIVIFKIVVKLIPTVW